MGAWCDQCHRKRGLSVWVPEPNLDYGEDHGSLLLGEAPANVVLAKIDALELNCSGELYPDFADDWYGLLNLGLHLPLVGGSGKRGNEQLLGGWRTYGRLQPGEERE